ncbi:hypothetical protein NKH84_05435 [Mesorhizobium sp. M0902]|uniref:hypothetical protein n=1 Tax=unclassified Mesorhizobium TaxID=325217 RepID=UPI0033352990
MNLGTLGPVQDDFFANAESAPSQLSPARNIAPTKTIADLKRLFLETKTEVTRSRSSQYRIPFRVLEEQIGPLQLSDINRERCRELMDFLPKVPSHAAQQYPKATLKEAAELYRLKTGAYSQLELA